MLESHVGLTSFISPCWLQIKMLHIIIIILSKGPAADATDAPQPWRLIVQPCDEDDEVFPAFPF